MFRGKKEVRFHPVQCTVTVEPEECTGQGRALARSADRPAPGRGILKRTTPELYPGT